MHAKILVRHSRPPEEAPVTESATKSSLREVPTMVRQVFSARTSDIATFLLSVSLSLFDHMAHCASTVDCWTGSWSSGDLKIWRLQIILRRKPGDWRLDWRGQDCPAVTWRRAFFVVAYQGLLRIRHWKWCAWKPHDCQATRPEKGHYGTKGRAGEAEKLANHGRQFGISK